VHSVPGFGPLRHHPAQVASARLAPQMSPDAVTRTHQAAYQMVGALLERDLFTGTGRVQAGGRPGPEPA